MDKTAQDLAQDPPCEHKDDRDNDNGDAWAEVGRRLHAYFSERNSEYRRLVSIRDKGWKSVEGDRYFESQRHVADRPNEKVRLTFYHMTQRIAREVHGPSRVFELPPGESRVLDMGTAPGGFLKYALDTNPTATAVGITLPAGNGGHVVMMPRTRRADMRFMDVTMLAEDLGIMLEDIPQSHPDAGRFLARQFDAKHRFGLIFCGGVVVRTQSRADYRQACEARRLETSQLSIGLEHLSPGGTMIVVMHRLESWRSICLLWRFKKFCDRVTVVKPLSGHAKKSSFYMVAQNVLSHHPEAIRAIEDWKMVWRVATFGTEEDYARQVAYGHQVSVETVLTELGQELLKWGDRVWKIQADALEAAPFNKQEVAKSVTEDVSTASPSGMGHK